MTQIILKGCSSENLMGYLKALGIFRILAEQKDSNILGRWEGNLFSIKSTVITSDENLTGFFRDEYRPSPIASPWNGGSGFYKGDKSARKNIEKLIQSSQERLDKYKISIGKIQDILHELGIEETKPKDDLKSVLIASLRARMPDEFIRWLDSTMALLTDRQDYMPLLGSGGNDGRMDFAKSFIDNLILAGIHKVPDTKSIDWLKSSLFGIPVNRLEKGPVGQFYPGQRGGANATSSGYERDSVVNPWDYIFTIEGTLLFSSAVTRKYLTEESSSFAFTIRNHIPMGKTESYSGQEAKSRGEIWLPAWHRWAGVEEVVYLFQEGRAEVKKHLVTSTSDFARAVAGLQVDRGLDSFYRFSFLERHGQSHIAILQDHFKVPDREMRNLNLFDELDVWLYKYRRYLGGNKNASEQKKRLYQSIQTQLYTYCKTEDNKHLTQLLITLGIAQQSFARQAGKRGADTIFPDPLFLNPKWAVACYDGSIEFRIALAVTTLFPGEKQKQVRCYFENVDTEKRSWQKEDKNTISHSSNLYVNLIEILKRRLLESEKASSGGYSLGKKCAYPLFYGDLQQFLSGSFEEEKTLQLLRSLMMIDWRYFPSIYSFRTQEPFLLPAGIGALKVLFLSDDNRLKIPGTNNYVPIETSIPPLLLAGNTKRAVELAVRRLSNSGYTIPSILTEIKTAYKAQNMVGALVLSLTSSTVHKLCDKIHIKQEKMFEEA